LQLREVVEDLIRFLLQLEEVILELLLLPQHLLELLLANFQALGLLRRRRTCRLCLLALLKDLVLQLGGLLDELHLLPHQHLDGLLGLAQAVLQLLALLLELGVFNGEEVGLALQLGHLLLEPGVAFAQLLKHGNLRHILPALVLLALLLDQVL